MKKLILLPLMIFGTMLSAQTDTVSIMYYNILDFPSGGSTRVDTLEKIIRYTEPDLLLVNELESQFGANLILSSAMNTQGVTHYDQAAFYNGPDTDNMLFYNNEKFGLIEQFQISTIVRDISEYHIYYKEPNLNSTGDTTHLWLYSCHLKAGSYQTDEDKRADEAETFKNYLVSLNRSGNMIIGGDFNFYTDAEAGCQTILDGSNIYFNDPINSMGNWHNNSFYLSSHTQSTRSATGFGGGSSGGMDDRFDFIFASDDIMQGSDRIAYLPGSYIAVGQDAGHYNGNINSGTNTAVPADIADALFYNSDHLPVYMEMVFDFPVGVQENQNLVSGFQLINSNLNIDLNEFNSGSLSVIDLSGKIVNTMSYENANSLKMNLNDVSPGIYIARILVDGEPTSIKFIVE